MTMNYRPYISRDPAIRGGDPIVAGTRVTPRTVLASLAEGMAPEAIVADFPSLTEASVRAVMAFAAATAEEDLPLPAIPDLASRASWTRTCRSVWSASSRSAVTTSRPHERKDSQAVPMLQPGRLPGRKSDAWSRRISTFPTGVNPRRALTRDCCSSACANRVRTKRYAGSLP